MINRTFCIGLILTLSAASLADVDPRTYIDPSLQGNVIMGSGTYYDKYFNSDGEQINDIPATLGCFAARNIKALQEAQS